MRGSSPSSSSVSASTSAFDSTRTAVTNGPENERRENDYAISSRDSARPTELISSGDVSDPEAETDTNAGTDSQKRFFVGQWLDIKDTVNQV